MATLGVFGSMVWDAIHPRIPGSAVVEQWGGLAYSLAAAEALQPKGIRMRPIVKLGRDREQSGREFLRSLATLESEAGVLVAEQPNPHVELRYVSDTRRTEKLEGGLTTWTWDELSKALDGVDALYLNFITGSELELATVRTLRRAFSGPIYADIHSLLLDMGPKGERRPRPLEDAATWLSCFDFVQVNDDELRVLSGGLDDPFHFAERVVGTQTRGMFVTLGARGATYVVSAPDPLLPISRSRPGPRIWRRKQLAAPTVKVVDPTGCGDVWGITCLIALLWGEEVERAVRGANELASFKVGHRGTSGLSAHLRAAIDEQSG